VNLNPKRVLFVCVGNSCRSQMAEGFARAYGSDVMAPASAGIAPALGVARDTRRVMAEKNVDLEDHFPKSLQQLRHIPFDLVVNMSGMELPGEVNSALRDWKVKDPIGQSYEVHREVRDQIETLVMELILEFRRARKPLTGAL
jgi:arsenate reductase